MRTNGIKRRLMSFALFEKTARISVSYSLFKCVLNYIQINRKACQVLTRLGADVNARDNDRWTPLMWAARVGCDKTSQELLNKQASLDHVNNSGNTPLHIASSYGNVKVVELLLNSGANVCIQNNLGQTCLDVAVQSGAGDVALAIAKHKRLV